jgi:hypothetical protein
MVARLRRGEGVVVPVARAVRCGWREYLIEGVAAVGVAAGAVAVGVEVKIVASAVGGDPDEVVDPRAEPTGISCGDQFAWPLAGGVVSIRSADTRET